MGRFEQETYILLVLTLFNLCGLMKKNCNDLKLWRLLYSLRSCTYSATLTVYCLEWWLLLLRLSFNLYALFVLCFFLFFFCLFALLPFLLFFFLLWVHFWIALLLLPPHKKNERFSPLHRFWTFDLCFTFLCGRISIRTQKKKH